MVATLRISGKRSEPRGMKISPKMLELRGCSSTGLRPSIKRETLFLSPATLRMNEAKVKSAGGGQREWLDGTRGDGPAGRFEGHQSCKQARAVQARQRSPDFVEPRLRWFAARAANRSLGMTSLAVFRLRRLPDSAVARSGCRQLRASARHVAGGAVGVGGGKGLPGCHLPGTLDMYVRRW